MAKRERNARLRLARAYRALMAAQETEQTKRTLRAAMLVVMAWERLADVGSGKALTQGV